MAPKQKGVKMALSDFLNDDSLGGGSWADDDLDFNKISVPSTRNFGQTGIPTGNANPRDPAFGGAPGAKRFDEYPIPDHPPYRARLNNLPWDCNEEAVAEWTAELLGTDAAIKDLSVPRDMEDSSRARGFAFITLDTREQLEEYVKCSGQEMFGRRVYVAVAAPDKGGFSSRRSGFGGDEPDLDWGSARGSGALPPREGRESRDGDFERRPRREEPDLDWGVARGSGTLPPREGREPRGDFERRPRREEPNLDWGASRGPSNLAPREPREGREPRGDFERRPRREEPELDWGASRGPSNLAPREQREHREPREPREPRGDFERKPKREEPDLDWGVARGSGTLPPRERKPREKKEEPAFDWSRGQALPARAPAAPKSVKKEESAPASAGSSSAAKPAIHKSAFSVLSAEDDEDEEPTALTTEDDAAAADELVEKAQGLSVEDGDAWEVVGKK